ncbi:MAG: hypothetical protein WC812_01190 [Candidatus Pacearchaeota archaeon]|jgi:hypothetical protein
MVTDDNNIPYLLDNIPYSENGLEEDLSILDGDERACMNWELRGKGFSFIRNPLSENSRSRDDEINNLIYSGEPIQIKKR